MTTHCLKTWPEPFQAVVDGIKRFEFRKNDRSFKVGDLLRLQEFIPCEKCKGSGFGWSWGKMFPCECPEPHGTYTGRETIWEISYIMQTGFGLSPGLCVLSLSNEQANPNVADPDVPYHGMLDVS